MQAPIETRRREFANELNRGITDMASDRISDAAFNLIVESEVSSQQDYEQKYRNPTWPGGASGVTIGIGYDVGYATKERLRVDWKGNIPDTMIAALEQALGVTGEDAKPLAQQLGAIVDVPWNAALAVLANTDIPHWVAIVERALPNTDAI